MFCDVKWALQSHWGILTFCSSILWFVTAVQRPPVPHTPSSHIFLLSHSRWSWIWGVSGTRSSSSSQFSSSPPVKKIDGKSDSLLSQLLQPFPLLSCRPAPISLPFYPPTPPSPIPPTPNNPIPFSTVGVSFFSFFFFFFSFFFFFLLSWLKTPVGIASKTRLKTEKKSTRELKNSHSRRTVGMMKGTMMMMMMMME